MNGNETPTLIDIVATRFNEGGVFMWVILGVLAVATAIVIERLIFYFFICRTNGVRMVSLVARELNTGNTKKAKEIVCCSKAPVNVLMHNALERYDEGLSFADIQEGVDETAIKELPRMGERLNYLSLFANVATLLGLLGTIAGLQVSFSSLATVEASKKAALLASGISQAMNTTAFGLIVAVPCMVFYTLLNNKKQQLLKDLDESVVRLMNYLKKKMG